MRRWVRPTARFLIDGVEPFDPFPRGNALPFFEWGVNWCFAQRFNQYVLLHAGVLALDDRAIIMAATPGSGKSTLAAGMMLAGFRLLSDEFGVLDPDDGTLLPMLKADCAQQERVDRDHPQRRAVGHPGANFLRHSQGRCGAPGARPGQRGAHSRSRASVAHHLSTLSRGARFELKPQLREESFARLAFNSFNYSLLGPVSFNAVADLAGRCQAYELTYSDLGEAIERLREHLTSTEPRVCAHEH